MTEEQSRNVAERMRQLARLVDTELNLVPGIRLNGFVIFAFPFDGPVGGRVNYISNADRGDMIEVVNEWLRRQGETSLEPA